MLVGTTRMGLPEPEFRLVSATFFLGVSMLGENTRALIFLRKTWAVSDFSVVVRSGVHRIDI